MGKPDFSPIFEALDTSCRGYLTADDVQKFHETLHFVPITKDQVNGAISQVCGRASEGRVHKELFIEVLQDLDRRKNLEQQVRWDFMALDKRGNHQLPLKDALLLFRETHGDKFSMHDWHAFMKSRVDQKADVYFDEIKLWLCNLPSGESCSPNELEMEEERLARHESNKDNEIYKDFNKLQEDTDDHVRTARDRQDYLDRTKQEAQKKLNRWQLGGVEALINDDGRELDDSLEPRQLHDTVTVNELLDALEQKYDLLREKLFSEMIRRQIGETLWSSLSGREQLDRFQHVVIQERKMRKDKVLAEEARDLFGAEVAYDATLVKLMGEIRSLHEKRAEDWKKKLSRQMKADGKTDDEIDAVLKEQYVSLIEGTDTAEQFIIDLYERHKDEQKSVSSQMKTGKVPGGGMMGELCRLTREHVLAQAESQFTMAATAVGLVERIQNFKSERYDSDRDRQLKVAETRLQERKGRKFKFQMDPTDSAIKKHQGIVDLQVAVTKELTRKHAFEREVMIQMLQGRNSQNAKAAGKRLTAEEREHQVKILRNQHTVWKDSDASDKKQNLSNHRRIIQEGVGLYYEDVRLESVSKKLPANDDSVNAAVLADLQQKQEQEFERVLYEMHNMIPKELHQLRAEEARATSEEYVDNIAALTLGSFDCTEEEKMYLVALDNKYDALREKLYVHALRNEKGVEAWDSYSFEEKIRLIVKKKLEDRRYHQEGKYDEMARILGQSGKLLPIVRSLIGDNRPESERRAAALLDKEQKLALTGKTLSWENEDEVAADHIKSLNHLGDLQIRYDMEQDFIIRRLRSPEIKQLSPQEREVIFIRLQLEWRQAEYEEEFEPAALSVGLLERVLDVEGKRSKTDNGRQQQLAKLCDEQRRSREKTGKKYEKQKDDQSFPHKEDALAWMELVMIELQKKHMDERELMLGILQDSSLEDLTEAARTMAKEERQKRLVELQVKRRSLRLNERSHRDENFSILEEAAAIRVVCKQELMKEMSGQEASVEEITVLLLTDLQDEQDKQMAKMLQKIGKLSGSELVETRSDECHLRKTEASECALSVLTKYEGVAEDDQLMKALEDKYDAMRDKLLMELMMKQMGEADWNRLSEKEKQAQLMKMKLEQRKLAREGKYDELARLLGDGQAQDESLRKLMGDNRADYEKKLREKMARRQRRKAEGLPPDSDEEGIEEGEEEGENALVDLEKRYEEERNALMARLKGFDDHVLGEKERQQEMMRLKLEKRKADSEDNFTTAAMLIGLSERQDAANNEKLKNDRQRQEMLAKQRLEALRKKRSQKVKVDDKTSVVTGGDRDTLQDAVMTLTEKKHEKEREQFLVFLDDNKHQDLQNWALVCTPMERQDKLMELNERRMQTPIDKSKDQHELLCQGTAVKLMAKKIQLSKPGQDVDVAAAHVSLMADLQERQEKEMQKLIEDIADLRADDMIELQKSVVQDMKIGRVENIATALFTLEEGKKSGEKELVTALEGKYDALRDKLIMEALIQQHGESNWKKMSERDRQQKLIEFKLKERKLRQEGKMEELAAMMGEHLKNKETLDNLLGDSKAEQESKLKERLERRRFRREQGLSDADCDRLEKQDIMQEEAEAKRKPRNILLDLETRLEDEKAALLRSLQGYDDNLSNEKARQAYLAKLHLQQRKALQEDRFDAAALVLSLGEDQEKTVEDCRRRQEQLAKDRLAQRLQEMKEKKGKLGLPPIAEVTLPEDEEDLVAMQEAVIAEMERKHTEEREVLIQLMHEGYGKPMFADICKTSESIRQEKLTELVTYRRQWREDGGTDPKEQMEILQEAILYKMSSSLEHLKASGQSAGQDEVFISLLADLQEKQEHESKMMMKDFLEKTPQTLKQLKNVHNLARKQAWYDNTAAVILKTDAAAQADEDADAQVLEAVEKKYDTLKDKILMEALMKQAGDVEWSRLTEKERQAKLIKLKMEEKRLRQEGRMDEASALIAGMLENQEELHKLLGDTKEQQRKKLEERLARRKELIREREEKGLSTDETILDAIQDQEQKLDEKTKRKNILEQLEYHLEEEKAALMATLSRQGTNLEAEKQRQKELARLKQEERRMRKEDKCLNAAMMVRAHEEQEKKLEANLVADRERQRALAKERLAARKQKKLQAEQDQRLIEEKLRLQQAENEFRDMMMAAEAQTEGIAAVQQALLEEVDKKQTQERETMLEVLNAAEAGGADVEEAQKKSPGELKMMLEKLRQDRVKWKNKSKQNAAKIKEDKMTEQEKEAHRKALAQSRAEQFSLLTKAMVYRIEAERQTHLQYDPNADLSSIHDEISIALMTDLQAKQDAENKVLTTVMVDHDKETLSKMKDLQRQSVNEGWMDNVVNAIFHMIEEADDTPLPDPDAERRILEEELKKEREEALEKCRNEAAPGEEIDTNAVLEELEAQHAVRRQALGEALEKKKNAAKAKLEARRVAKDEQEYMELAAIEVAKMSEMIAKEKLNLPDEDRSVASDVRVTERQSEKRKPENLLQQRLKERKRQRRQAAAVDRPPPPDDDVDALPVRPATMPLPSTGASLGVGLGLHREKTVIDEQAIVEEGKAIYRRMVAEETRVASKKSHDRSRQKEKVERILQEKIDKRQSEAASIISKGEKNKLLLEKTLMSERERQMTMMKDRFAKKRFERTMTMRQKASQATAQFDSLIQDSSDLTGDDKMELAAKKMQAKFKSDEVEVKAGRMKLGPDEDEELVEDQEISRKGNKPQERNLKEKEKLSILKQRRMERKKNKQEK